MKKRNNRSNEEKERHPHKKIFIVNEGETVDDCLARMKKEGYDPVMRTQRPIFREGASGPEVAGRYCVIEGRLRPPKGEQ